MPILFDYTKELLDIARQYPGLHYISFLNESKYKSFFDDSTALHYFHILLSEGKLKYTEESRVYPTEQKSHTT